MQNNDTVLSKFVNEFCEFPTYSTIRKFVNSTNEDDNLYDYFTMFKKEKVYTIVREILESYKQDVNFDKLINFNKMQLKVVKKTLHETNASSLDALLSLSEITFEIFVFLNIFANANYDYQYILSLNRLLKYKKRTNQATSKNEIEYFLEHCF